MPITTVHFGFAKGENHCSYGAHQPARTMFRSNSQIYLTAESRRVKRRVSLSLFLYSVRLCDNLCG